MKNKIYIVVKNYNPNLAKRQPWYSVKKLVVNLEKLNYKVIIINNFEVIPKDFVGVVIKFYGVKDLLKSSEEKYTLVYLISFPFYSIKDFYSLGLKIFIENWRDLYSIFFVALIPGFIIKNSFLRANKVITISDRSFDYLNSIGVKSLKYYPFLFDNWGGIKPHKRQKNTVTLGYFGPPYSTRCYDKVVDFFTWIEKKDFGYNKKIITRIEKEDLLNKQKSFHEKFQEANIELVSGMLNRDKLAKELSSIDVFILPFEIIMSELPIVVLAALELNAKLVTTLDSGISQLTKNSNGVLILNKFCRNEFQNIIDFINNSQNHKFEITKNKIININNQTISKICQK